MPRLKLLDIRCIKHTEVGGDEPYLKVGGNTVWKHGDMHAGMMFSLRSIPPMPFGQDLLVELMESDSVRDDKLGAGTVSAYALGHGQMELNFTEGGGHYQLIYEILH